MLAADKNHQSEQPQPNPNHPGYAALQTPTWKHWVYKVEYYSALVWQKLLVIALLIHSAVGLYESFTFLFFEYPEFEAMLQENLISVEQVRLLIAESIGLMLATLLVLAMAIRLSKDQEKLMRYIELIIGSAVIIWHDQFIAYLQNFDYLALLEGIRSIL